MRNPRRILIVVGVTALAAGLATILALTAYSGSDGARASLLVKYFRALSSGDETATAELTSPSFQSDLGLGRLERGSYELYDFGGEGEGTMRFLLIAPDAGGEKRAVLADIEIQRHGLMNRIEAIRRLDEGKRLKE